MTKKSLAKSDIAYTVSVIIASYQTGPVLIRSIESVLSQQNLKELIIVDNGNCRYLKGNIQELLNHTDKIHIISGRANVGFARSCNIAASSATGDYLLILDPNCILPNNAFAKAIDPLLDGSDYWMTGCKIVDQNYNEQKGNRRNLFSWTTLLSDWFGVYNFSHLRKLELKDTETTKLVSNVPAISSSFMMMSKDKYQQLGQMDENYFYTMEDLDLCFQIYQMGGKIAFVSNLEVVKYPSVRKTSQLTLNKHIAKSLIYYFKKNYNGAYPVGTINLLALLIISRFLLQSIITTFKICLGKIFKNLFEPFSDKKNLIQYANFIEKYTEFETPDEKIDPGSKYSLINREPVLITNIDNQSGAAILQRLLAANIQVIALYKNVFIDIYHPKLTLIPYTSSSSNLDIPSNMSIKTVICTSSMQKLPPYIAKLTATGVSRIIVINDLPSSYSNKESIFEQDMARICKANNIDYTILRTSFIYGLDNHNWLNSIYNFIKYFKSFPITEDDFEIYSPVHVDDVAISALLILNISKTYGKTYNLLGGDDKISYYDIVGKTFEYANVKINISRSRFKVIIFKLFNKIITNGNSSDIKKYLKEAEYFTIDQAKADFKYNPVKFLEATIEDIGANRK
jgi:N-acetylglucosaminyl-diphospho-decaprenol L-rhamnosyltransferase